MAESFYVAGDFDGSSEFVEGQTSLSTRMRAEANLTITALSLYFPDVAPSGTVVGRVYADTGGAALATCSWSASPTLGAVNTATLSAPLSWPSGTIYRVTHVTPNRYEAEGGFFSGGSITRGNITALDGRFASGDAFPNSAAQTTTYWTDVVAELDSGEVTGVATANLGALTAAANGLRTVFGAAAGALGALTAAASGKRTVNGAAAAPLGALTAAAAGQRTVYGLAAANLGALAATATDGISPPGSGPRIVASTPVGRITATTSGGRL